MIYDNFVLPHLIRMSEDDPEKAHIYTLEKLKQLQANPFVRRAVEWWYRARQNPSPVKFAGITFPNSVGLAAGFLKNAEALLAMQAFGFGFIEIGSVLPKFQPGSLRPRMFRYPKHQAVVNRMGFNSEGMDAVEANLATQQSHLRIPIGLSLGKHKDTPNEEAEKDYVKVFRRLWKYGSYAAVNISSPNTQGLRDLQAKREVERVVGAVVRAAKEVVRDSIHQPKPIFVKLSPDLTQEQLEDTLEGCENAGASGYILCNTTTNEGVKNEIGTLEQGGVSGHLNFDRMREVVRFVRARLPHTVIIGVGGIDTGERALLTLQDGADLVQVYTGMIFNGPELIWDCRQSTDPYDHH